MKVPLGALAFANEAKAELRGHSDGHGGGIATGAGHGHASRRRRSGRCPAPAQFVRVLREEPVLDDLGQRLAAEGVGVGLVGEVGQAAPGRSSPACRRPGRPWVARGSAAPTTVGYTDEVVAASASTWPAPTLTRRVVGAVALRRRRCSGWAVPMRKFGDDRGLLARRSGRRRPGRPLMRWRTRAADARDLRGRHGGAGHGAGTRRRGRRT